MRRGGQDGSRERGVDDGGEEDGFEAGCAEGGKVRASLLEKRKTRGTHKTERYLTEVLTMARST